MSNIWVVVVVASVVGACVRPQDCDPQHRCVWDATVAHGVCSPQFQPRCVLPATWNGTGCECRHVGGTVPCNACPAGRHGPFCVAGAASSPTAVPSLAQGFAELPSSSPCDSDAWGDTQAGGCYPQDLFVWRNTVPAQAGGVAAVLAETQTWRPVVSWLVAVALVAVLGCGACVGAAAAALFLGPPE